MNINKNEGENRRIGIRSNLTRIVFYGLMVSLLNLLTGQSLKNVISVANVDSHVEKLASDEFLGRRPGTVGEEKTVEYLIQQLRAMGVSPPGDQYKQEFAISQLRNFDASAMTIKSRDDSRVFQYQSDFYVGTNMIVDEGVSLDETEMVFAGFGIVAPEYGWDDYSDIDVNGKVVVVMFSDPGFYQEDPTFFNGMQPTRYSGFSYKKQMAFDRGAVGVLMIFNDVMNWEAIGRSRDSRGPLLLDDQPNLVSDGLKISGIISIPVMQYLLQASNLESDYEADALSENFKARELDTKVSIRAKAYSEEVIKTSNVIGMIQGAKRPDECIVYTAHWDHVGTRPAALGADSIFNGAVDNASGTAMLLEVARAFSQLDRRPERSVIFLFTSAEEMGLLGAEYYTSNPVIPLHKTVCVINADSNYPTARMKTVVNALYGMSEMDEYNDEAASALGRTIIPDDSPPEMNIFRRGDHYPFVRKGGVPGTWMVGASDPINNDPKEDQLIANYAQHYHQVTDEYYEGFNAENIAFDAHLDFLIGLKMANSKAWPNWNKKSVYRKIRNQSLLENKKK